MNPLFNEYYRERKMSKVVLQLLLIIVTIPKKMVYYL